MNLDIVNRRIDQALHDNRRAENIVIGMSVGIFILGFSVVIIAYWRSNPYIGTGVLLLQSFLYWPIREILKLRRDNLILQSLPALLANLTPTAAANEIRKFLEYLRQR